jgi:hypothetical protein
MLDAVAQICSKAFDRLAGRLRRNINECELHSWAYIIIKLQHASREQVLVSILLGLATCRSLNAVTG